MPRTRSFSNATTPENLGLPAPPSSARNARNARHPNNGRINHPKLVELQSGPLLQRTSLRNVKYARYEIGFTANFDVLYLRQTFLKSKREFATINSD